MKKYFLFLIPGLFISCGKTQEEKIEDKKWKTIEINSDIKNNTNFKKFSNEKEFSVMFDSATLQSKTNNILFLENEKINLRDTLDTKNEMFIRNRTCTVHYWKSDTLLINVMNSDGFTGNGFGISVFKKKYKIKYSSFSDAGPSKFNNSNLKINFSRLILDKKKYEENDSIYGFVEFKCVDDKTYLKPVEYYAKGYFKTKVDRYQ